TKIEGRGSKTKWMTQSSIFDPLSSILDLLFRLLACGEIQRLVSAQREDPILNRHIIAERRHSFHQIRVSSLWRPNNVNTKLTCSTTLVAMGRKRPRGCQLVE